MKRLLVGVFCVMACNTLAQAADMPVKAEPAAPELPRWIFSTATEFRYYSWQSSRASPPNINAQAGRGSQIYIPFAAQLVGRPNNDVKFELLARGGYVYAQQTSLGLSGKVQTETDTQLSAKMTYYGFNGVQPFAALMVNLPTGKSALFGQSANARMDSDLVGLGGYGEGFNIGPTIGFNLPITTGLIFTASAGYTARGKFLRESSLAPVAPPTLVQTATVVNPGDVATWTASLGGKSGSWQTTLTGSMSMETNTSENSVALFRAGTKYTAAATVAYNWERIGETSLSGGYTHTNRNKVLQPFSFDPIELSWEQFNTNSDVYRVGAQHLFPFGSLWAGPIGSYLHRTHNGYDAETLQFVPAKDRWSGGMLARYAASDKITLNARVEYVYTREEDNPTNELGNKVSALNNGNQSPALFIPVVSGYGWQVFGGVNAKF